MAYVNRHNANKAIVAALTADATVLSLLGTPPRVYLHVPSSAVLPYVRLDFIASGGYQFAVFGTPSPNYIRHHRVQLTAYSLQTGASECAAIQKAVGDVMDKLPGLAQAAFTGGKIIGCIPGANDFIDWDEDEKTMMGVLEFNLWLQSQ